MTKLGTFSPVLAAMSLLVASACNSGEGLDGTRQAIVEEPVCGDNVAPLMTKDSVNIGSVTTSNSATHLFVDVKAASGSDFAFSDIYVFVGTGDIPRDSNNLPLLSSFVIHDANISPGVSSRQYSFLLSDYLSGDPVGQSLNISVFARARHADAGDYFSAWAYGEDSTGCGCYGVVYPYTICGQPTCEDHGCTLTQGYWKTHNSDARRPRNVDWPAPMEEHGLICSTETRDNLALLNLPPSRGDAYLILAKQLLAADLNIANGASSPAQVSSAIIAANALIAAHCGDYVAASSADGQEMTILAGVLDAYNNGLVGPGHCN